MNEETCMTCRFYWGDALDGYCRRFPPRETRSGMMGTFPRTPAEGWCGEHATPIPVPVSI